VQTSCQSHASETMNSQKKITFLHNLRKKIFIKYLVLLVVFLGILAYSSVSVPALTWFQPKTPTITNNFSNFTDYLNYLNATKVDRGEQIPANLVNKTTGTFWLNQLLDTILDSIYTSLSGISGQVTTLNSSIDSVNSSLYAYINSLNMSLTNLSKVKVYYEYVNITTSGGFGTANSPNLIGFEISRITVTPISLSTAYNFKAQELLSNTVIDQNRETHTGVWDIYKHHDISGDNVNFTIKNAVPDDTFQIKLTYIDNFRP